jgi:Raf kinase inhibitor-like YbhB/YbcL family protein
MRALVLGTAVAFAFAAAAATPALAEFMLASTDVKAGAPMAMAQVFDGYGCTGKNISPALSWSGEPAGTQSFAITIFDPDAPTGSGWWHWTVFNIPASVHSLPAGAGTDSSHDLPAGASQGRNDFGFSYYGGPCPPAGAHAHHYEITVYALKVATLPLDASASGAKVGFAVNANTLASAKIVGRYSR